MLPPLLTLTAPVTELVAALNSLEKIAWVRLDDETARFTVIPDTGSQVWASLSVDLIFDSYHIQSAEPNNTINLELPLGPLQRALKSAAGSNQANLRLTKRDGIPMLSMTIHAMTKDGAQEARGGGAYTNQYGGGHGGGGGADGDPFGDTSDLFQQESLELTLKREREKVITQDIPVRVLHPDTVETIMQPKVREPDVHIQLPPLLQLKAISDRFTKLAMTTSSSGRGGGGSSQNPKLELSANMFGSLRLRLTAESLDITSVWDGLENPELDPSQLTVPLDEHPSTRFKQGGPNKWATVRVDGKDWSRVLSVGRLEGRVIACFADDHALILYVYVPHQDDATAEDVVTVSDYSDFPFSGSDADISGSIMSHHTALDPPRECITGRYKYPILSAMRRAVGPGFIGTRGHGMNIYGVGVLVNAYPFSHNAAYIISNCNALMARQDPVAKENQTPGKPRHRYTSTLISQAKVKVFPSSYSLLF